MSLSKPPPYPYCDAPSCFRHGMYDGKCPEHRIAELEAKHIALVDELHKKMTRWTNDEVHWIDCVEDVRELLGKESEG